MSLGAALLAPPVAFLFVFFILIHSLNHFSILYKKLAYNSIARFIRDLVPMTLLSYLGAFALFVFFTYDLSWQGKSFATLMYLLAALTLPHLLIVELFRRTQPKSFG